MTFASKPTLCGNGKLSIYSPIRSDNLPISPRAFTTAFNSQAKSWQQAWSVVAKIEWHAGELFPHIDFIMTNLNKQAKNVVKFYNGQGTAGQWLKEGENAVKWTKRFCRTFKDNQARFQLFALSYILANFLRRLALPKPVRHWLLTTLREQLVKIGAQVTRHAKYFTFQLAEVVVPCWGCSLRSSAGSYGGLFRPGLLCQLVNVIGRCESKFLRAQYGHQRIMTQLLMLVEILIAEGNSQNALGREFLGGMHREPRTTVVIKTIRERLDEAGLRIQFAKWHPRPCPKLLPGQRT